MPSGLRQTPLGARKPVARISVRVPSLLTLQQRAVVRHQRGQAVAGRLGVVEVALGVGLQAHRELVEVLGDLVVAVEVLVEVGLAVAVEVAEADDLVAAADVDPARDDLQPQRLEQTRRRSAARSGLAPAASIPPTSQTSPSQVQTAARWPSGRKSNPESRIWQSQGLLSGTVRTSTANGPSSRPMMAWVLRTSGQRRGPPCVSGSSDVGGGEDWPRTLVARSSRRSTSAP